MGRERKVVEAVALDRVMLLAAVLFAVIAFGLTVARAVHPVGAVVEMALGDCFFAALEVFNARQSTKGLSYPTRVDKAGLPTQASAVAHAAWRVALLVVALVAVEFWAVDRRPQELWFFGVFLAGPVQLWVALRRNTQLQRQRQATLFVTTGLAWGDFFRRRRKVPARYLVPFDAKV